MGFSLTRRRGIAVAILCFVSAGILTGCYDGDDSLLSSARENAAKVMTEKENNLVRALSGSEHEKMIPVYQAILSKRVKFGEDSSPKKPSEATVPFCDVIDVYDKASLSMLKQCYSNTDCKERQINYQWMTQYGKTLTEECRGEEYRAYLKKMQDEARRKEQLAKERLQQEQAEAERARALEQEKLNHDTVVIDGERYISAEMYAKVRGSIKDCERARMKFMQLTSESPYLTVDMYNDLNKMILGCEVFKTEKEIQEPSSK